MKNKINITFRLLFLLLTLIVSGCAQLPPTEQALPINSTWESQKLKLEQLTAWSFSGKLGVFSPEGRDSVNINWQQSQENFHIILTGPLGISVLEINKINQNTLIIDDKSYVSDNFDSLIMELSGMALPVEELQQWIKGNPHEARYQLDENNQLQSVLGGQENSGLWVITYSDFRDVNNINLPYNLQLTRGDLRLKFKISSWEVPLPKQPLQ